MNRLGAFILVMGLLLPAQTAQADWTPAKRLTWTSSYFGWSEDPTVAVDSNNAIHVVWADFEPGNFELYYKRSTDGGTSWTPAQRLTWNENESEDPAMAIDSNDTIHVVWKDQTPGNYELYYKRSTDGGASWRPAQRLTWTSDASRDPAITTDLNNAIHVVWTEDTPDNDEIYYKRSTDGGMSWGAAQRLTWISDESRFPAIATDLNSNIHVVWNAHKPGNEEIYYKRTTDGGTSWTAAQRLTWTSEDSWFPAVAIDSSNHIHIVFREEYTPGSPELYYKRSTNGGAAWSAAQRLTWTSDASLLPAIATSLSSNVHVVWYDYTPGNAEIYYKKSADGGTTWGAAQRLTWTPDSSELPAITVDSNNFIHIVYKDYTPGNSEIYYKKGN